jgi:hypothetical protein
MSKYYNGLLVAVVVCSAVNGITASEKTSEPSFIESTQERLKDTAVCYGVGYALLHYFGTSVTPVFALMGTDFERNWAKARGEKFSFGKTVTTFGQELGDSFLTANKAIIRSHRIAAPVVFGSSLAWHMLDSLDKYNANKAK